MSWAAKGLWESEFLALRGFKGRFVFSHSSFSLFAEHLKSQRQVFTGNMCGHTHKLATQGGFFIQRLQLWVYEWGTQRPLPVYEGLVRSCRTCPEFTLSDPIGLGKRRGWLSYKHECGLARGATVTGFHETILVRVGAGRESFAAGGGWVVGLEGGCVPTTGRLILCSRCLLGSGAASPARCRLGDRNLRSPSRSAGSMQSPTSSVG